MTDRPWRAVAYYPLPGGGRLIVRRTARKTRRRLTRWIADAEGEGLTVDRWQVRPIPEVEAALTQQSRSLAG